MNNSQVEPYTLSPWAKEKGMTHCFIYHGISMNPTYQNGDFLYVREETRNLRVGDVIVFSSLNDPSRTTVHRIISPSNSGYITRGDHNRLNDVKPISIERIIGKVEYLENNRGTRQAVNGTFGLLWARIWHTIIAVDRFSRRLFWLPYNFIRKKQIARKFWRPKLVKLKLQSEKGQRIKYIFKKKTVAVWDSTNQWFECRKPFDLIISSPIETTELSE